MTNYIWRVKDKSGKSVVREINANTAEEAKAMLISEGCTDLELFQEDFGAAAVEELEKGAKFFGKEIKVTAEQRLEQWNKPPPTLWKAIVQSFSQEGIVVYCFFLVFCAVFVYRGYFILASIMALGLLAWLLFFIGVSLPSIYYHRLIKAADWNRWDEVFDMAGKLEASAKISFVKTPALALARFKAIALAGTDRLSEALEYYKQFENRPDCPSWLYQGLMSGIYNAAHRYDKSLECCLKCVEAKPTAVSYLDLANQMARYHKDTVKAREALNEADKFTLPEMAKPFRHRCLGIIAYWEGNLAEAKQELENAIRLMEATPNQPGRDGSISIAKAYLACVLARLGEATEAAINFEKAKAYLVATKENELLAECEKALGKTI